MFRFLRLHRHELLNEGFQAKLASMYADDYEPGRPPVPPALLVLVTILQAYTDVSDADAVHHALFDKRWQMVLDCMGCDADGDGKAPFSQGLLAEFRFRLIGADMDRELVRRTVELAKETKDFGFKALKVALDSAPLWGAGRVEDTFNLIGHGLLVCVACAADVGDLAADDVLAAAELQIVGKSSVKAGLDIDWDNKDAKGQALNRLLDDVTRFEQWLSRQPERNEPEKQLERKALDAAVAQLKRLVSQDTEPDPGGSGARIRKGTAPGRQISIGDAEMRHGRKSKSTKITGYKAHVGYELEHQLVLDAVVTPAERPECEGGDQMRPNIEYYAPVGELNIDRGYLSAGWVTDLDAAGVPVYSKPWNPDNGGLYQKSDFTIDVVERQVTCPAGETVPFPGQRGVEGRRQVTFRGCSTCKLRALCTDSARGRSVDLHENEALLQTLLARKRTPEGRKKLRERVGIEHNLAHVRVYQPRRARYVGTRKNTFAVRRAGAIVNLQTIDARPV